MAVREISVYVTLESWREVDNTFTLFVRHKRFIKYLNEKMGDNITFRVPSNRLQIFNRMIRAFYARKGIGVKSVLTADQFFEEKRKRDLEFWKQINS